MVIKIGVIQPRGSTVLNAWFMVEPYRSFIHHASQISWDSAVTLPCTIPATSFSLFSSNSAWSVRPTTYPLRCRGAVEDSIEVYVEIDEQAQKVTAIAMGSTEVKTTDLMKNCDEKEAVSIAAASMGVAEDKVNLEATNGQIFVATCRQGNKNQLRGRSL